MQEFGPPPGKMSIDERRAHLAQVKQEYERSLTEFDSKIMEQVGTVCSSIECLNVAFASILS